jgi:hypothetical protein
MFQQILDFPQFLAVLVVEMNKIEKAHLLISCVGLEPSHDTEQHLFRLFLLKVLFLFFLKAISRPSMGYKLG